MSPLQSSGHAFGQASRPASRQVSNQIPRAAHGLRVVRNDPAQAVVAVSGLHRGENPQPGSAVIAALRRVYPTVRVIGLSYDSLESGIYSGDVLGDAPDAVYTMPYPSAGAEVYFERLAEVHRHEGLDMVLPCLDTEVDLLAANLDRLVALGIRSFLPTSASVQLRDKAQLAKLAKLAGCPVPATRLVHDIAGLREAAWELGHTVFVKGRLYEARAASSVHELDAAFWQMLEKWGAPVLVQQRIEGEEYNVVGLGDGEGGLLGHCALRKMLRTASGKGYGGMVVEDALLTERTRSLVAALKWRGPFELEFVRSEAQADYYLIEINPRFPAWVGFPASIGCNLPARALEIALCRPAKQPLAHPAPGNFFVRHCVDVAGSLANLQALSVGGVLGAPDHETAARSSSVPQFDPASLPADLFAGAR